MSTVCYEGPLPLRMDDFLIDGVRGWIWIPGSVGEPGQTVR